MGFLYALVLTVHVLVSVFLIMVVLLQSGRSGDIASAFGGAGTQTVFGPRGTGNVLSRATTISAVVFMVTSLLLVGLSQTVRSRSVVREPAGGGAAPTAPAPATPQAPPAGGQPPAGQ